MKLADQGVESAFARTKVGKVLRVVQSTCACYGDYSIYSFIYIQNI